MSIKKIKQIIISLLVALSCFNIFEPIEVHATGQMGKIDIRVI